MLIAKLLDEVQAEQSYAQLMQVLQGIELPAGHSLHVAGKGAFSRYLGSYISSDAQPLSPIAALAVCLIVFTFFIRGGIAVVAKFIIAASALITLGAMALYCVSFYVITNALPVILIGIAVADIIHIYSEYFQRRALQKMKPLMILLLNNILAMWRPISLTLLWERKLLSHMVTVRWLQIHSLDDGDAVIQLLLSYSYEENLDVYIGVDSFYGGWDELLGQFSQSDRLNIGFAWSF